MKNRVFWLLIVFGLLNWMVLEAGRGVLEEILLESASRGNHERIEKLLALDFKADVNARNRNGDTALLIAARSGMLETVKILIRHGANPDIRNRSGDTALLSAIKISSTSGEYLSRVNEIASLLIEKGTALSYGDTYGRTYLMLAAENGKPSVIQCLLSRPGIEIDSRDRQGLTALMYAVRSRRYAAAKALVAAGAKTYLRDNMGKTALHYGTVDPGIAVLLLDHGALIEATDRRGFTPLMQAVEYGNREVVRVLLDRGSDVNAVDFSDGRSPLMLAINRQDMDMASQLLKGGADANLADKQGRFPIYQAAVSGFSSIIALLLDHGSPVDAVTTQGTTPLMGACEHGYIGCARLLLKRGAAIEATSKCGWSPLFYAVYDGHHDMARLLVDKGADTKRRDSSGRTPLDLARERKFVEIVNLLI